MSGITADNLERSSGLVKAASVGPSTGSSNPTVTTNPSAVGDRFINTTSGEVFVCTDATTDENKWEGQLDTSVAPPKFFGGRGIWAGGESPFVDTIDYVTISSLGNASDFGDIVTAKGFMGAGVSNGPRGTFAGGGGAPSFSNIIDYVTIASLGNATDFGDITVSRDAGAATSGDAS